MTLAPCQASWQPRTIEYRGTHEPQIQSATDGQRGTMPKSRHRKSAPAAPAPSQAEGHTYPSPQNDSHDSPPGDAKPQMTQNDSHFRAPNPEMTQNDSLFQASMPQMSQNDSHFEVFSFEMTQNCLKMTHFCPTPTPLDTPSPELTTHQRPRLPHKMTHLTATPALPDTSQGDNQKTLASEVL